MNKTNFKTIVLGIVLLLTTICCMEKPTGGFLAKLKPTGHNSLAASVVVNGIEIDSMIIDTGAECGLFLRYSDYCAMKKRGLLTQDNYLGEVSNSLVGGRKLLNVRYSLTVQIGNVQVKGVPVTFNVREPKDSNRLVGMALLRRFGGFTIDYYSNTLYLYK